MFDWLRSLDAHPKTRDEFRVRTLQGGISTVVAVVVAYWLVKSELRASLSVYTTDRLYVNSSHGALVSVAFDIEFPNIPCDLMSVNAMDQSGSPLAFKQHVRKLRLVDGSRRTFHSRPQIGQTATHEDHFLNTSDCGDCYGAQDEEIQCCETCDDVRLAYRRKGWTFRSGTVAQCRGEGTAKVLSSEEGGEGCALAGDLRLPAVSGNFHFAPGRHIAEARHVAASELVALTFNQFNVSHVIKRLEFSTVKDLSRNDDDDDDDTSTRRQRRERRKRRRRAKTIAATSQLSGERRWIRDGYAMHQYYLKVVPTQYRRLDGDLTSSAQYSVTEHLRHVSPGSGRGLPGVFFFYEVSPVCAEVVEQRDGFFSFFVGLSAIIGGVYVTFGFLDRILAYFLDFCFHPDAPILD